MTVAQRFQQWRQISQIDPVEEAPSVAGGREAEVLLGELAESFFRSKDAYLLAGRRIPSKRFGRRREIDLIVCTPQMIHIIEVKNWAGQLSAQDGVWRQTRRSGDILEHENPIEKNLVKRDVTVEYLRQCGIKLDKRFVRTHFVSKIVFMNRDLQLDPSVEEHPDVISRHKLDEYLGRQKRKTWAERLFSSFVECCLDSEKKLGEKAAESVTGRIPTPLYNRIVACLSQTGTWDHLHLYGTKILAGDLVAVRVDNKVYRRAELLRMTGGKPIRLKWTRGRIGGVLKALTGIGSLGTMHAGDQRLSVAPEDAVEFHQVGTKETAERRLADVDEIVLG